MDVKDDLALAHLLADAAASIAVSRFQPAGMRAEHKPDGSLVTEVDLLVEESLRGLLARHRPDDTFVGEETGGSASPGGRRWFVDPLDGTRSYAAGRTDWRTLIAVEVMGVVTVGLANSPMLGRRWWAVRWGGAWRRTASDAPADRLQVSGQRSLAAAQVGIWPPVERLPASMGGPAARLAASCSRPRVDAQPAGDTGHGALLVASGVIDAFLFVGAGPWDLAAMVAIVEEAGGRFGDAAAGRSLDAPAAVFSNGLLHEQILECLSP